MIMELFFNILVILQNLSFTTQKTTKLFLLKLFQQMEVGMGHYLLSSGIIKKKLICGGIGAGAKTALVEKQIEIFGGVSGDADQRVNELLAGKLEFDPNKVCSHHHDGGHDCGEDHQGCSGNCDSQPHKTSISTLKPGSLLKKN